MSITTQQTSDIVELSDFKIEFKKPKDWTTPNGSVIKYHSFKKLLRTDLRQIFADKGIDDPDIEEREIVAQVFPFKINQHIVDQINWDSAKPILFQLTFPQKEMLSPKRSTRY